MKSKKPKRRTIPQLRKELWRLTSRWVRSQEHECYTCGKRIDDHRKCDAGHYIPRARRSSLYYDIRNVHTQCVVCNQYMSGNLTKYALHLIKDYGAGILDEFDRLSREPFKPGHQWYEEKIREYKEKLGE